MMVIENFYPRMGGAEVHVYNLSRSLIRRGHEVYVVTQLFARDKLCEKINGIKIYRIRKTKVGNLVRLFISIIFLVRELKIDVIHAHMATRYGCAGAIASLFTKKPLVVTEHGRGVRSFLEYVKLRGSREYINKKVSDFFRTLTFCNADVVISVSREIAEIIKEKIKTKVKVKLIPNGVDADLFNPDKYKVASVTPTVVTTRRLVPKTGIQFLVSAIPKILREVSEANFIIVGDGPLRARLLEEVKKLGVEKSVRFVGMVPNKQVPRYLSLANVVVFPSAAEATSISCLEAMSMKKPVVSTKVGGLSKIVIDNYNGVIVDLFGEKSNYAPGRLPNEKIDKLAKAVIRVLKSSSLQKRLGANGRKLVLKNFTWDVISKEIEAIYQEVLAR